ncbi:MAG: hypothetical protein GXP55_22445 [Deltaproteobacteria bacterium]|nr:hypothetical protein [Deltaproteobacteria bacterium]
MNLRLVSATLCLSVLLGLRPSPSHAEVIERVVAVVNDNAIFLSQVRRRMLPFLPRVFELPSQEQRVAALAELRTQVVERLVQEELFRQAASQMHIRVTNSDVDRAVHNVMQQNGLTEEQFWTAVEGQGFTRIQYRTDLRRQLLRLKVLNQRARGRVNITDEDVRRVYEQRVGQAHRSVRFHVAHAFFGIPPGSAPQAIADLHAQAEAVRRQADPDSFTDLGWVSQGDLPPVLEHAVADLTPGQTSPVVRGDTGFHVFRLIERGSSEDDVPTYEQLRDEIYRGLLDRAMQHQEETLLDELRRDASVDVRMQSPASRPSDQNAAP